MKRILGRVAEHRAESEVRHIVLSDASFLRLSSSYVTQDNTIRQHLALPIHRTQQGNI